MKKTKECIIKVVLFSCGFFSVFITLSIIFILFYESRYFFNQVSLIEFLTSLHWSPLFATKQFGILPLLSATIITTLIAIAVALPLGIMTAIYLSEYTKEKTRLIIKHILELLAGIPSIVWGYFALLSVTPTLQKIIPNLAGFNALSAGIVMGMMILPLVCSLSEDALRAVPLTYREAAYALGSTRVQVVFRIVIPAAFPGIAASIILAISRALGETMIVAIAAGMQPRFGFNPLVPIQTMTAYIIQVSQGDVPYGTLEYQAIFAVGMMLFITTFIFNTIVFVIKKKFQQLYA